MDVSRERHLSNLAHMALASWFSGDVLSLYLPTKIAIVEPLQLEEKTV